MLLRISDKSIISPRVWASKWPLALVFGYLLVIQLNLLTLNTVSGQRAGRYDQPHQQSAVRRDYYYTRTRRDPQHLRVSEEFKNTYVNDVKYESRVNGTKYEYYKSSLSPMSFDELVFETIDKMFRHRLSPFYLHHYDNEDDKRHSSDPSKVSHESCARDLLYLVDKLPKKRSQQMNYDEQFYNDEDQSLTPELTAFFDSYARQEAGLLMGNTFWVGAYDQCVNRHIFELVDTSDGQREQVGQREHVQRIINGMSPATPNGDDRDQKVISFKGRYCVASLKAPIWDKLIDIKKKTAKNYFKTSKQISEYPNLFRLQLGICLPDSCDSNSLGSHSDEIKLLTTSMLDARYNDYDLIDLYCLPDESSPLRQWSGAARNFVILITIWMAFIVLATIADVCEFVDINKSAEVDKVTGKKPRAKKLTQLVSWFSLRANYTKLMHVSPADECQSKTAAEEHVKAQESKDQVATTPDSATSEKKEAATTSEKTSPDEHLNVNLRFLNAFKVMIMFWIVNGHIMLLMIQTAKNILYSDALLNELMHFLIGATFGVDLFFTMTGFLTSYLIFNSGHAYKMRITTWLYLSFHRYWRLAPMYLLAFWFSRSVMQMLGSGPLWDYGTSALTFRGLCNSESWWFPFTLTSNLHGLFEECMITSWYISCDMQFWLVSPIFIHLLAKHPSSGWLAAVATIFASSKVRYDAILSDKSARYDELVQPRADIFMRVSHDLPALYTHPHYRIAAYLVGLLAGHYVYMVKSHQWKSSISFDMWNRQQQPAASAEVRQLEVGVNKTGSSTTKSIPCQVGASKRRRNTVAYFGLFLFLVMSFASFILSHHYPNSLLKYAKSVAAYAYALDHLAMSVGASMVIISMCFGQWPSLVKFLSHPNWTRLSKINYALLLLQCEAIYYQIFRYEQVPMAGTRELINILFNLLATLYPVAFAVTLVFEFPLANIEKLLLG